MATTPVNFDDLGGKVVQPAPSSQTFDFSDLGGKVVKAAPGQVRNDVGNTVIVPKDDESFADTMKRAANYGKTVTQPQIDAEMKSAPAKVAETLVAAPTIGAATPASEAAGGAGIAGMLPRVLPGTIAGVKAVGAWAKEHPALAYIIYDQLKRHSSVIPFIKGMPSGTEQ
jgi:hypothetical protein